MDENMTEPSSKPEETTKEEAVDEQEQEQDQESPSKEDRKEEKKDPEVMKEEPSAADEDTSSLEKNGNNGSTVEHEGEDGYDREEDVEGEEIVEVEAEIVDEESIVERVENSHQNTDLTTNGHGGPTAEGSLPLPDRTKAEMDTNMKELAWWVANHSDEYDNIDWLAVQKEGSYPVRTMIEQNPGVLSIGNLIPENLTEEFYRFLEKMKRAVATESTPKSIKMLLANRQKDNNPDNQQKHTTTATGAETSKQRRQSAPSGRVTDCTYNLTKPELQELASLYFQSKRLPGRSTWKWDFVMANASAGIQKAVNLAQKRKGFLQSPLHTLIRSWQKEDFYRYMSELEKDYGGGSFKKDPGSTVTTTPKSFTPGSKSPLSSTSNDEERNRRRRISEDGPANHLVVSNKRDKTKGLTPVELELAWLREESRFAVEGGKGRVNWDFVIKYAQGDLKIILETEATKKRWTGGNRVHKIVRKSALEWFDQESKSITKQLEQGYRRDHLREYMSTGSVGSGGVAKLPGSASVSSSRTYISAKKKDATSVPYKPVFSDGEKVYVQTDKEKPTENESWRKAIIIGGDIDKQYLSTVSWKYSVQFMDGVIEDDVDEIYVKSAEEYIWCSENDVDDDLKGVIPCVDPNSDDPFVRIRGWYATITSDEAAFSSLHAAMRSYDNHTVQDKMEKTLAEDLNLPMEWVIGPAGTVPIRLSQDERKAMQEKINAEMREEEMEKMGAETTTAVPADDEEKPEVATQHESNDDNSDGGDETLKRKRDEDGGNEREKLPKTANENSGEAATSMEAETTEEPDKAAATTIESVMTASATEVPDKATATADDTENAATGEDATPSMTTVPNPLEEADTSLAARLSRDNHEQNRKSLVPPQPPQATNQVLRQRPASEQRHVQSRSIPRAMHAQQPPTQHNTAGQAAAAAAAARGGQAPYSIMMFQQQQQNNRASFLQSSPQNHNHANFRQSSVSANADEYQRLLRWYSRKQNIRWISFETFFQSEWTMVMNYTPDERHRQWNNFQWDQQRSWKDFCQEEASALQNHCVECNTWAASARNQHHQVLAQRFHGLRLERLEDFLRRFQQDADRFHSQPQQAQLSGSRQFVENQKYRWHAYSLAEHALMDDHVAECPKI